MESYRPFLMMVGAAALIGCGGGEDPSFTIQFAAQVGAQPLRCDATFPGIGTSGSAMSLRDFKAYVHDVTLVRANGERHPIALEQDGRWQHGGVALLDFEDGTGTCDIGSSEVHTAVTGTAPEFEDYTGVEFKLGVPAELNHLNSATAEAPLNLMDMFWSWKDGYRFLRLDVRTTANPNFVFHLGSDGCEGTPGDGYTCASANHVNPTLTGFDPNSSRVVFDLAALFAETDLDHVVDMQTDFVSGCMMSDADPECAPLLSRLGLGTSPASVTGPDAFIRVE